MGAEAMQEKPSPISRDTQETYPDWSTLVGQAVDDVSRILHSETQLLQINLSAALKVQIDYALAGLAMVAAFICAAICILAALILLLHQSFQSRDGIPWWQAFAVGALFMFVVGIAIQRIAARRAQRLKEMTSSFRVGAS
jgi:preprotein translocase subunit SecY